MNRNERTNEWMNEWMNEKRCLSACIFVIKRTSNCTDLRRNACLHQRIFSLACLFVVKGTSNYADCKCWWNLRRWNFCSPMSALHIFASIPLILLGLTWGFASWGSRLRLSPDQVHRKTVRPAAYAGMGHRNKVMFCYVDTGTLAIRAEQNISTLLYLFRAKNCLSCAALLFSDEWWVLYSFFC